MPHGGGSHSSSHSGGGGGGYSSYRWTTLFDFSQDTKTILICCFFSSVYYGGYYGGSGGGGGGCNVLSCERKKLLSEREMIILFLPLYVSGIICAFFTAIFFVLMLWIFIPSNINYAVEMDPYETRFDYHFSSSRTRMYRQVRKFADLLRWLTFCTKALVWKLSPQFGRNCVFVPRLS